MTIFRWRQVTQAASFLLLTYGGRVGIHLGFAVPCFSCPYVNGCGGYCFLMLFQRVGIFGLAAYDQLFTYNGLRYFLWFLVFALLCLLFSKLWCGWICPFGTVQDLLSALRRRWGVRGVVLSPQALAAIRPVKYVFLGIIVVLPFLLLWGLLPEDCFILFCKVCPAHPIMPLFAGDVRRFALDYANPTTLALSLLNLAFAGLVVVGAFFKDRFFCLVCPMLPLIQLFGRFSPFRFQKRAGRCSGCGNCRRLCPMAISSVHEAHEDGAVMETDCILCTECIQACPAEGALRLDGGTKTVVSSSRETFLQRFQGGNPRG